jgi:hypothetical protein
MAGVLALLAMNNTPLNAVRTHWLQEPANNQNEI